MVYRGLVYLLLIVWASWWLPCRAVAQSNDPQHVAPTDPLSPVEQQKRFRLPPGFEIQLVAAEPDVRKPINMSFDARGRLLVTQSVEYPFPAADSAKARDRVSALEDFAPGGKARKVSVLVDRLNIPIGIAPLSDGVLVYSIPSLLRCRDTNGDGAMDRREEILRPFGYGDTHGMVNNLRRWIDGWVYACHGYSNTSTAKGTDGRTITMHSGNTFRFREDGSQLEYFTHGQVNPFGLAFDPLGNLFSCDCHSLPAYQLIRGAWYPSFGKPHDGLGFGPAIMSHPHGSTGLAGIVYYAADHFPAEYHDTLFIGNPITHRINHDKLKWHGSTPRAIEQPDFLVCDDPWFRPVDLQLGPDGALYVADFYNRIIGHYEVDLRHPLRDRERGRIWRIVYRGKEGDAPPPRIPADLMALPVSDLLKFLDNPNLTLRALATNELVERADGARRPDVVSSLSNRLRGAKKADVPSTALQRAHLLWASQRCGSLRPGEIELLAGDASPLVRVHLVKALGEHQEWDDIDDLVRSKLADKDPFVRRAAVDSLGRHPAAENIEPLLKLWETTSAEDTHLIHTMRIALRDHLLVKGAYEKLKPLLEKQPQYVHRVAKVSLGTRTAESGGFVLDYLIAHPHDGGVLDAYLHHAARYVRKADLAAVFGHARSYQSAPLERQRVAVRALHRGLQERGTSLPEDLQNWAKTVAQQLLKSKDEAQLRGGVEIAKDIRIRGVFSDVAACISSTSTPELRSLACEALGVIDAAAAVEPLAAIVGEGADALDVRRKAAAVLAGLNEARAREALLKHLPAAPAALAVEMAHGLSRSREGGQALVAAAEKGKASARLLQDRTVLNNLQQSQPAELLKRVASLTVGLSPVEERIAQLIEERRNAFVASNARPEDGRAVFKKICAACHKINGEGNKIGPELDGIGLRGLDRLIEDILDPSRTVDEAFRATQILTKDGRTVQGLKLRMEGEVLVLADNEGKEQRVPSDQIERQALTKLSPMPANVGEALPADDLSRLLKFLLAQRQAAKGPIEKSAH